MRKTLWLCAAAIVAQSLSISSLHADGAPEFQEPVRLPIFNYPDSDFITNTYGQLLEKAGYNVEYIKIDYTAHFTAIEYGDVDVSPAVWSSSPDLITKALESGQVTKVGDLGVHIRETWWYPSYVADLCPGLPDWTALKQPNCIAALSTPETDGKINYLGTPLDFDSDDDRRIKALGLDVHMTLPGTIATMIATMQGAIQKKQPIVGFGFVPHWLYGSDQGAFVNFPPYEEGCTTDPAWGVNPNELGDCERPQGDILKFVNNDFAKKAPFATTILKHFTLTSDEVANAISRQERDGKSAEEASMEWIVANEGKWPAWLK
jgi:glycine betaine/proline transport system substrate-binding protein